MLNNLKVERWCCVLNNLLLLKSHLKIKNLYHNNIRTLQGIFSEMLSALVGCRQLFCYFMSLNLPKAYINKLAKHALGHPKNL